MSNGTDCRLCRIAVVVGVALLCALGVAMGLDRLVAAAPAASPIYVRPGGDDANCDGTLDIDYPGGGPTNCAVQTIQQGIDLVDAGGTVYVAAGTYAGGNTIDRNLTLQGAGAGSTIVDAGGSGRSFYINTPVTATISGLTIRNGSNTTGAGIYVRGGSLLTLTNSTVRDNDCGTSTDGGGVYIESNGSAVISDSNFISNTAGSSRVGGAIRAGANATLVVVDSTFTDNSAGDGGALGISGSGNSVNVTGSTFTGNDAGEGGAIYFLGPAADSLVVSESAFTGNTASGLTYSYGGAIRIVGGTAVISNTTITGNTSTYAGGGISASSAKVHVFGSVVSGNSCTSVGDAFGGGVYNYSTKLTIEQSVVRDNWVDGPGGLGGGIFNDGFTTLDRVTVSGNRSEDYRSGGIHSQDPLTLTNVTISGNEAQEFAGALMQTGGGVASIVNCTIVNNTVTAGGGNGGMHIYTTVNMTNTLLAYNDNFNCVVAGTLNSGGYNLEDGNTCTLGATGDITGTDPLLFYLTYYGGPSVGAVGSQEQMLSHALRSVSPAIDGADNAVCPAVDQRGVSRPIDGDGDTTATCDIGAFEFNFVNGSFLPVAVRNY